MKENMMKHLKRKMLLIIMTFVTIVIVGLVLVIIMVPARQRRSEIKNFLQETVERDVQPFTDEDMTPPKADDPQAETLPEDQKNRNQNDLNQKSLNQNDQKQDDTKLPPPVKRQNLYLTSNIATVLLDEQGGIADWSSNREDIFDEELLEQVVQKAISEDKEFGKVQGLYYMNRQTPDGEKFIFLDDRLAVSGNRQTAIMACVAGVMAWLILFVLSVYLVKRMVEPVRQAFEKQRQFISDAGHELKTPIAVIEANASVLENEIGANKWLSYITSEAERMEHLVRDLMTLASMEETERKMHTSLNLSKTVMGALLPFESMAFEKHISLESDVAPDICIQGDREQIEQLMGIFLNNAIKYGEEQGTIRVSLTSHQKKAVLSVYNTGQGIAAEERDRIFERFYRTDKSRARKGNSYGLGLAIAKMIVEEHHARIEVTGEQGKWIQFSVVFSL